MGASGPSSELAARVGVLRDDLAWPTSIERRSLPREAAGMSSVLKNVQQRPVGVHCRTVVMLLHTE
jgi:hypothetical protein